MTREQQERRILGYALAGTSALYGLVLLVLLISGLLNLETLSPDAGKVLVKLGNPDALESQIPNRPLEDPLPAQEETLPLDAPAEPALAEAESAAKPLENNPAKTAEKPETEDKGKTKEAASSQEKSRPANSAPPQTSPSSQVPAVYKGSDQGNSWELNAQAEGVNFQLSPELTELLPLPKKIPARLVDNASQALKNNPKFFTFGFYYPEAKRDNFGDYYLDAGFMSPSERIEVWQILKALGYRSSDADYFKELKGEGTAKFIISIGPNGGKPTKVEIEQSSGSAGADEGLRQGLLQTSFSNASGKESRLRFSYTFR